MMLLMKFDYDWPAGLRDIDVRKCELTDARLKSHTISSPEAFGSGELKKKKKNHIVLAAGQLNFDPTLTLQQGN